MWTSIFHLAAVDIQREIIAPAQSYIGSGYCRGGIAPPCFDCSGFVTALYRPFLPDLPRISRDMARSGAAVDRNALRPGDLVFFTTAGRSDAITHVAIYIGQDSIIHAISDGPNRGVTVTPLSARYWRTRYHSARRVFSPERARQDREGDEIRFANGVYSGDLRDGEPHGSGEMIMDNGDRYRGEFAGGVFHGEGTYRWANGDTYEGAFVDGEMHGSGVFTPVSGASLRGRWVRGEYATDRDEAGPSRNTYMDTAESPWDTWDGIVEGDYYAWREAEQDAFEQFKADEGAWRN